MSFESILFRAADASSPVTSRQPPTFFRDLHLDMVVDAVVASYGAYDLRPLFYTSLSDLDAITYRQEVMRDLEDEGLRHVVRSFSERMQGMRSHLDRSKKGYYLYEREQWFLEAVSTYCCAVRALALELGQLQPASRGLRGLREYLVTYVGGSIFDDLSTEARRLKSALSAIRYCLLINGNVVNVRPLDGEPDYSTAVEETFAKFQRGATKDYRVRFTERQDMNHVEAQVLDGVAHLHPETFRALGTYSAARSGYLDERIARFDREAQFYVSYLAYADRFRGAGLSFCYPRLSATSKEITSRRGFDPALADVLLRSGSAVVCNDFCLREKERVLVVTGPNQGGKTTFARTFGQLHYLASLGCPVPGTEARVFLFDRLFSHFEREEHLQSIRGKLQDELVRVHAILVEATPSSVVVINEIFSSTTLDDAVFLSREIMARISTLDLVGIWVTFLTELASFDDKTVSIVAAVDAEDPTVRTYKVERAPPGGPAYALSIAEKYGLTYERLRKRVKP